MATDSKDDRGHFSSSYALESSEDTLKHYSSWAATYDKEVGVDNAYAQPTRTAEMLGRYLPSPDIRILDAGCGSGLSGEALRAHGYREIDGCDFSPEMLEISSQKNCYRTLFEADLNIGLPQVSDDTYDAVVCVGVFSFGHVMPNACDDLLRVLRKGGILIIALNEKFWARGDLAAKIDQLEKDGIVRVKAREYGDHLPGHDVKGWVLALEKV